MSSIWKKGDKWKTKHGFIFAVVKIKRDGSAMLQMLRPKVKRLFRQKLVPADWKKQ